MARRTFVKAPDAAAPPPAPAVAPPQFQSAAAASPAAPLLTPRPPPAAAQMPETPAPIRAPRVEIGRLVVEVTPEAPPPAPEPDRPSTPPPRTAEQASSIGPIGDLRMGARRFTPGWW